ncbi:MAG: ribonuclease HI family protein [Pseudomonadota bacterium]
MNKARFIRQCPASDPLVWQAWFDGSATPNPGRLGLGVLLRDPTGGTRGFSQAAGYGDSTVAEYLALILSLEQALLSQATRLMVYGDSQIVIQDVLGVVPVRRGDCVEYRCHVRTLMAQFAEISLKWIPRAKNTDADKLSHDAFVQNISNNV